MTESSFRIKTLTRGPHQGQIKNKSRHNNLQRCQIAPARQNSPGVVAAGAAAAGVDIIGGLGLAVVTWPRLRLVLRLGPLLAREQLLEVLELEEALLLTSV